MLCAELAASSDIYFKCVGCAGASTSRSGNPDQYQLRMQQQQRAQLQQVEQQTRTQQQQQSQQSTGGYDQQFLEQQRQQMARIEQNRQSSSSTGQNQDHSLLQQQRQMAQIQQQRQNSRLPPQPPSFSGASASNPSTSSAAFEQHWSGNRSNQNAAGGTEYQRQQSTLISMGFTDTAVRAFDCCCNFLILCFRQANAVALQEANGDVAQATNMLSG